jgi:hypothetical protein
MTPERTADLVRRWVRRYTRGLPTPVAERRIEEIDADLLEHIAHERARGAGDRRITVGIASRMVRGLAADAAWRDGVIIGHPWTPAEARRRGRAAYRRAVGVGGAATLVLVWLIGAVGIIGDSGDSADLMYGGVLAVGAVGSVIARFRPLGMARVLVAMAIVQLSVGVIALIAGMVPSYNSPLEILGLSGFFVVLFIGSAWLFRRAGRQQPREGRGPAAQE